MKGATNKQDLLDAGNYISIHAPMKGATVCPAYLPITMSDFNPRTHEGCDVERTKNINYEHISIHAPMKGATFCCCERLKLACNFNPRTHEGCDVPSGALSPAVMLFQSTHP